MMQLNKKDKTILKEFFKFLKENNALNEYKINMINRRLEQNLASALAPFSGFKTLKTNPYGFFCGIVSSSFIWGGTPQGHRYWSKLNEKWRNYLSSIELDNHIK